MVEKEPLHEGLMTLVVTENADGTLTFDLEVDESTGQTGDVRQIALDRLLGRGRSAADDQSAVTAPASMGRGVSSFSAGITSRANRSMLCCASSMGMLP